MVSLAVAANAQTLAPTSAPATPADVLQADVAALRSIFPPNSPIWLRFTLWNPGSDPVDVTFTGPAQADEAISLPLGLIIGDGAGANSPLTVQYQGDPPAPVRPQAHNAVETTEQMFRLGPRGSVGIEVDLAELYPQARYPGNYRIEWRVPGTRGPAAVATFRIEQRKDAVLVTDHGKVTFRLIYDKAPLNVANFLDLVRTRFYEGRKFHRIVSDFLMQGGCPIGNGAGIRPDGKLIPAEFNDMPLDLGTLAMARKPNDENSASCQFFIALARLPELDGQYTVIGQASDEESLRTLQTLAAQPTDRDHRPIRDVIIRSINLVDVESAAINRVEVKPR